MRSFVGTEAHKPGTAVSTTAPGPEAQYEVVARLRLGPPQVAAAPEAEPQRSMYVGRSRRARYRSIGSFI